MILNDSNASTPRNIFSESLSSPGCVQISFACIRNAGKQIIQLMDMVKTTQGSQIIKKLKKKILSRRISSALNNERNITKSIHSP